jgi:hypothetical protein
MGRPWPTAAEGPAAPEIDALKHGCVHPGRTYLLQAREVVQVDVLQLGEFLHCTLCFISLRHLGVPWEDLPD